MRQSRRGGWRSRRTGVGRVGIESLERRSLFAATVPVNDPPAALSPGTVAGPAPVLANDAPTFTWSAVPGVSGYQLHVYNKANREVLSEDVGSTITSYTAAVGALTPGGQFIWDVRDVVGATATKLVSARLNFALPALAQPVSLTPGTTAGPDQGLDTVAPTFTWSGVAGVNGYELRVYNRVNHTVYSVTLGSTVTSYTAPAGALAPGGKFVWNVRDVTGKTAVWIVSDQRSFDLPALPAPTVIGPGSAGSPTIVTTLTPTFTWDAVTSITGFNGYQINLFDQTAHTAQTLVAPPTTTSYIAPAGKLISGHTYVWSLRLRAGSLTGAGASEPILHFKIHLTPAPTAAVVPVDAGT